MTPTVEALTERALELLRLVKGADSIELKPHCRRALPVRGRRLWMWIRSRPRSVRCSSSTLPTSTSTGLVSSLAPAGSRVAATTR